jgi:hypothetical protein
MGQEQASSPAKAHDKRKPSRCAGETRKGSTKNGPEKPKQKRRPKAPLEMLW